MPFRLDRALMFQAIPPCGGIRRGQKATKAIKEFQVIPPCGGIRRRRRGYCVGRTVSSHTPLRGYSWRPSPRGWGQWSFKSYPLAGVFSITNKSGKFQLRVSSHTPLRGYSTVLPPDVFDTRWFQVIPPCGGIPHGFCRLMTATSFKSYPLAGVFRSLPRTPGNQKRFKSYPLAGVFDIGKYIRVVAIQFQVIPPCGGIPVHKDAVYKLVYIRFKSYPLAGVFGWQIIVKTRFSSFKSYPLAGVFDLFAFKLCVPRGVSSHTPLRGYSALDRA